MTYSQQQRLVAVLSILILAIYFPAASYLQRTYVSDMAPPPHGAARQIFNLGRYGKDGLGFIERIGGYQPVSGLRIYEDDRALTEARDVSEVNSVPGRFAQEGGIGIVLSATDGSDVKTNRYRYWIVKPDAPR